MKLKNIAVISVLLVLSLGHICFAERDQIEFSQKEKEFISTHPEIKLGVDPKFIPFEFIDTDGQYKGIAADYIQLLSKRIGIKMTIVPNLTWSEAYEKAVEKQIDVLPCVAKTKERERYFIFSYPYYSFQSVIVVNNNNHTITKFEDLLNKTAAVKTNSSQHSFLKTYDSIHLNLYPSVDKALSAVNNGSELAFVGNLATTSYFIKTNGLTNLKFVPIESQNKQYLYFAVRPDWPELVSIINKGLNSITEEEKIGINNRWIGIENEIDYSGIIKVICIIGTIILIVLLVSSFWIIKLKKEVAERICAQEALKVAKEEAEMANHIKSSFLARMSHEIRTPLNAITGLTYLIRKTEITTTQKMYLEKITQATHNMLGIITDILDFSKIEAGKIELERISFNLDKVLQQVVNIISFKIEEQGIDFNIQKHPAVPIDFWGDPVRLEQILLNIINNAVKFTPEGEVSVTIRLLKTEGNLYYIEFSVKDSGIGMSDEQLHQLFIPFDQGDSSINRRFGGTGLGLCIVKSLVDMMGGEIQVSSTLGTGSTITITLPLEVDINKAREDKQKSTSICLQHLKIMVLEKNTNYLNLLKDYLFSFNLSPELISSESVALQLLRNASCSQQPYDLLIVDYKTPSQNGVEFIQKIKQDPDIINTPKFILMVPLLKEDLFEVTETMGIDFCIAKPIIPSILFNGIIEIFKDKVITTIDHLPADTQNQAVSDYPYGVLIVEDNKTNQFISKSILEQAGFKVVLADNGKEGYHYFIDHQDEIDIILMDLHMPVLNGYEATSLIREINTSIPIIALTADAISGVEEKCKNIGIDYYISKPFDPEKMVTTLLATLKTVKNERKMSLNNDTSAEKETAPCSMALSDVILDEIDGMKRIGNNASLYHMILKEYLIENTDVLSAITTLINEKKYSDAVQIVHKIKSSSGNIGAKKLLELCSEFQNALVNSDEASIIRLLDEFQSMLRQLFNEISQKII